MIVTEENFNECIQRIKDENFVSFDTETTGLRAYQGDRLFSAIFGTPTNTYYFNFNSAGDDSLNGRDTLLARSRLQEMFPIFQNTLKTVFMANAKFDMHMVAVEGFTGFKCNIHDVLVHERLIYNDLPKYSLETVAKRYGYEKSDVVEDYIKEHKLWEWVEVPGKKKRVKNKFFSKVPLEVIAPYGEMDGRITFDIGMKQLEKLNPPEKSPRPTPYSVSEMETKLTPVLFRMEHEGLLIDTELCTTKAYEHTTLYDRAAREFHDKTGVSFTDSSEVLSPLFHKAGFTPPKTEKGADSFTDEWLTVINHPLGNLVREYRTHSKIANTYYRNFLWYQDSKKVIHADLNQGGARTGRLSSANPNLQNVPDTDIRKAFLALPDHCLLSIDFDQQEYKVMLDYAKEMSIVQAILERGLDVHAACAELMGVERTPAKTLNFMLLYGGGTVKLALGLYPVTTGEAELWVIWKEHCGWKLYTDEQKVQKRVTDQMRIENLPWLLKAQGLRDLYFEKLPKVQEFITNVKDTAKERGWIKTWSGRKLHFKKGFHYKAPNGLVQGGSADVSKYGMIELDKFLARRKSKMICQIHDEVIFNLHKDELEIVPELQHLMVKVYPHQVIPLTTSANYSWKNLGELEKGLPVKETRDAV